AELFGVPGIEADREVINLLASALAAAGIARIHLDLGHVGIYRALVAGAGLAGNGESDAIFDALRVKDRPAVAALTSRLPRAWGDALVALTTLYGPAQEVLSAARRELPDVPAIANALATLADLAASATSRVQALDVDLGDLRGYHYHNGVIFTAYAPGSPTALGNGGRYDGIGRAFGRSRPATGFTLYLRQLTDLVAEA
ncbi:MAG: ATP phosphoribosyltransferase regulatory subunit, partial [Casimicrobiaceae bacterium]